MLSLAGQSSTATFSNGGSSPDRAGFMMIPGQSTAPQGWLTCDGTAVSRTTYADLFTAIGTAFGVGDGSTTFNLPDLSIDVGGVSRNCVIKAFNDSGAVNFSTTQAIIDGATIYSQLATGPSAPATGYLAVYAKNDGNLYKKTPAGVETEIGGGGGSPLTSSEEGTPVSTATTTLNFTGAGITASLTSPGVVEVNVPGGGGGITYVEKTSNYTAVSGDYLLANTSGGAFTITLPASPAVGASVVIYDARSTWATNNLTIARNGSNIVSAASDFTANVNTIRLEIIYVGGSVGWNVYSN